MSTATLEPKKQEQEPQNNSNEELKNPFLETEENPFDVNDLEALDSPESTSESEPVEEPQPEPPQKRLHPILIAQLAAVFVLVFGCIYTLTRPCVIGECQEIQTAREFNQKSKQTIETVGSAKAPALAQEDLISGIRLLETIPFWSPHYPEAEALLTIYRKESGELDSVNQALTIANEASIISQNPPHPIEDWMKMQSLWEEAVALLERVPSDSLIYPFAQARWQQYRANLADVRGRLKLEREAQLTLESAKKVAQVAEARQGVAKYADSWQQVFDSWQNAANTLAAVPYGTTAHQSAQVLLARYQPKLESARDRKTIEEVGEEAYNQAISNSEQAQLLEQRGLWSEAVTYWSRAVTYAKQVPMSSSYFAKIQPLLTTFNESWKRADNKNRIVSRMDKARQDLTKLCSGNPKVCNFGVNENLITVRLTSDYVNKIKTTATVAEQNGNIKQRSEAEKHVQTLKVALQTISENAKIPLEVYGLNNEKIATHFPLQ